jgi:hypothetical protein
MKSNLPAYELLCSSDIYAQRYSNMLQMSGPRLLGAGRGATTKTHMLFFEMPTIGARPAFHDLNDALTISPILYHAPANARARNQASQLRIPPAHSDRHHAIESSIITRGTARQGLRGPRRRATHQDQGPPRPSLPQRHPWRTCAARSRRRFCRMRLVFPCKQAGHRSAR